MTEDQTMRSLLAVHRTELDERDQKNAPTRASDYQEATTE